jgi:hypothetical protein
MREISKNLKCVVMRNGIEIWKEDDRLTELAKKLSSGQKIGFIQIDDELINSADIVGIFSANVMEDMVRRKNGQWKCQYGKWHDKGERCYCQENQPKRCMKCNRIPISYVLKDGGILCIDCWQG